ncbi:MAG: hypothetical protein JJT96_11445 [Opitutales bacterium]|nr:hypothetical protein [Opitutales bacterium]
MIDHNDAPQDPDVEALRRLVSERMNRINSMPDPAAGGLSPEEVHRLLYTPWSDPASPLQFNPALTFADLEGSIIFRQTRRFLIALSESAPVKTTKQGALPRAFVAPLVDVLLDENEARKAKAVNKVFNETDLFPLHIARLLCQQAGVIGKAKGCLVIRKKYAHLLEEAHAGELFALLVETYFQKFNLEYMTRGPDIPAIQITFPFILYRFHGLVGKSLPIESVPEHVLLPTALAALQSVADDNPYLPLPRLVSNRILYPLNKLGLVMTPEDPQGFIRESGTRVHPTPLLGKAMQFRF